MRWNMMLLLIIQYGFIVHILRSNSFWFKFNKQRESVRARISPHSVITLDLWFYNNHSISFRTRSQLILLFYNFDLHHMKSSSRCEIVFRLFFFVSHPPNSYLHHTDLLLMCFSVASLLFLLTLSTFIFLSHSLYL